MADPLTIALQIDRSQARQAVQAEVAATRDLVAAAKASGDAQEEAGRRGARGANQARDATGRLVAGARQAGDAAAEAGVKGEAGFTRMGIASALATIGFQKILDIVGAIGQGIDAAAQKQEQLTKQFGSQRDKLAELAALEGKQLTNQYTVDFAKFQAATGMRPDEALTLRTEFLNSGAQYIGKNISEEEAAQLQVQVGRLALAKGLAPAQMGDLAGNLLGMKDWGMGDRASEDVLGTTSRVMAILQRGRGDTSTLLKGTTALMAATVNEDALKGIFRTPEEAAGLISTMAESKPEEAEVFARASIRALRDPKLMAAAGITPLMPYGESAERFGALVNRRSAAEGVPIQDIIAEYAPEEREKIALATLISKGIGPGGTLAQRAEYAKGFGTESALADVERFRATDAGLSREAEAGLALEEAQRAAQFSSADILRKQAIGELRREGTIDTTDESIRNLMLNKISFGALPDAQRMEIDKRVAEMLARRAGEGGIDDSMFGEAGQFGRLGRRWLDRSWRPEDAANVFRDTAGELEARGIDPYHDKPGGGGAVARETAEAGRTNALLEEQNRIMRAEERRRPTVPLARPRPAGAGRTP